MQYDILNSFYFGHDENLKNNLPWLTLFSSRQNVFKCEKIKMQPHKKQFS